MDLRIPSEGAVFCTPDWRGIVGPLIPSVSAKDSERADAELAQRIIDAMDDGEVFNSAAHLASKFA
jgi:hypothetical protein